MEKYKATYGKASSYNPSIQESLSEIERYLESISESCDDYTLENSAKARLHLLNIREKLKSK